MSGTFVEYALGPAGEVRRWLGAGPVAASLPDLGEVIAPDASPFAPGGRWAISNAPDSLGLKARVDRWLKDPGWRPGRRPALCRSGPAGRRWEYVETGDDQVVDFSLFNFTPARMDAWVYAGLVAAEPCTAHGELLTVGPARAWVNGVRILDHAGFGYVEPNVVPLSLSLSPGWNDLWLHGRTIGWREARLALGMRLRPPTGVQTAIPLGGVPAKRWQRAEEQLARLSVRRFAWVDGTVRVSLDRRAPSPLDLRAEIVAVPARVFFPGRLGVRRRAGRIATARLRVRPGTDAEISYKAVGADRAGLPFQGRHVVRLRLSKGTPFDVEREVWLGRGDAPAGDSYEARRREALHSVAGTPAHVLGSMAAVDVGTSRRIDRDAVALACDFLEHRCDCADFYAVDLLVLLERFAGSLALPPLDRGRIEKACWGFKYWIDEPGVDGMCYHTENHQILFHVAAYLAGQRWPDVVFTNSGRTGGQQMRRATVRIQEWVLRRLRCGFSEWDSNTYLALDAYAMLALVEFARSHALRRMATALLHKIFFVLACQSWRGIHGCSHGRAYTESLKTARTERTSGLQRIAWGLGVFNDEVRATGLLAMARRYRVPDLLQQIGADGPALLVTRTRSAGRFRPRFDLRHGRWDVSTLTRRTPDGMLSAALDHRPGEIGIQEHLWQATLGPEAVVFTTHPGNSQEHESARPNFWAGSARLPRVAMADDSVVCVYNLSLGGGLGLTHAYFPAAVFSEYTLDGSWAFARADKGYVALWGDGDLRLTETGPHAAQELRSAGRGSTWACRVGGAASSRSFEEFCRTTRGRAPRVVQERVVWETAAGRVLEVPWTGPLRLDGRPFDPKSFPHYDNRYTRTPVGAKTMSIGVHGRRLDLDLVRGAVR